MSLISQQLARVVANVHFLLGGRAFTRMPSLFAASKFSTGPIHPSSLSTSTGVLNVNQNQCRCDLGVISNFSRRYSSSTKELQSPAKPLEKTETAELSKTDSTLPAGLVFNHERHNMYICWHPEVDFPYEMTKPIDANAPVADSNLKIQALTPVREAFRRKHEKMMIQELIKLTYSTKHRFFGKYGKRKRLVLREMDPNKQKRNREFL